MYTKPIIYKVYSIAVAVLTFLGFLGGLASAVFFLLAALIPNLSVDFDTSTSIILSVTMLLSSILSLFTGYMEFSSFFTFSNLIKYTNSGNTNAFLKSKFTLSGKAYYEYGAAALAFVFICNVFSLILTFMSSGKFFLLIISAMGALFSVFLAFVIYYIRYKAFGDLLAVVSCKNPDSNDKKRLNDTNPKHLNVYCDLLFAVAVLITLICIAGIVVLFIFSNLLTPVFLIVGTILTVISLVSLWVSLSMIGCFLGDTAKLYSHYLPIYLTAKCIHCAANISEDTEICPLCGRPSFTEIPLKSSADRVLKTDRGLLKYILLSLVTFGIYPIVMFSGISRDINTVATKHDKKKTMHYCLVHFLLSPLTLGIWSLVWFHMLTDRIGRELHTRAIDYRLSVADFWLWNILGSLIVVGPFIYIYKLTKAVNLLAADFNLKGE